MLTARLNRRPTQSGNRPRFALRAIAVALVASTLSNLQAQVPVGGIKASSLAPGGMSWPEAIESAPPDLRELAVAMRQSQQALLEWPEGLSLSYTLRVEQDPRSGPMAFESGVGEIRVRWPNLYSRFGALLRASDGSLVDTVREASHDFSLGCGTALDTAKQGYLVPYRHAWSCHYLFPLRLLFWPVSEQRYRSERCLGGDYWLPDALVARGAEFAIEGQESVNGIECRVVRRGRADAIWVATGHGMLVCRRELRSPDTGALWETQLAEQLREWAPGVWLPSRLQQTVYSRQDGRPVYAITCQLGQVVAGQTTVEQTQLRIPPGTLEVQDQIRNLVLRNPEGPDPILAALGEARQELASHPAARPPLLTWALTGLAGALGLLIVVLAWFRRVG